MITERSQNLKRESMRLVELWQGKAWKKRGAGGGKTRFFPWEWKGPGFASER